MIFPKMARGGGCHSLTATGTGMERGARATAGYRLLLEHLGMRRCGGQVQNSS